MYQKLFLLVCVVLVLGVGTTDYCSAALVAWYEFEHGVDDSVDAHHATVYGDPTYVTGKFGQAINFDFGGDDYVLIPDFTYATAEGDFSVSFWFKQSAYSITGDSQNYGYMLNHGNTNRNNSITVFTRANDVADPERVKSVLRLADPLDPGDMTTSSGEGHTYTTAQQLTDGEWHMWTFTSSSVDGSVIYVDASVVSTDPNFKGAPMDPDMDIYIARKSDNTRCYGAAGDDDGLLDDLGFWNEALGADQVADIYAYGVPEPATISILAIGGLALLYRRNKK